MTVIGDMIGAQGGGANQANSPSEWRAQEYRERKSSYTQLKGRLGASKDQLLLLPAGWLAVGSDRPAIYPLYPAPPSTQPHHLVRHTEIHL